MGLNISGLINRDIIKTLTLDNFFGKDIGIDAFNVIYQFLSVIRDNRNRPLKNINGDITSHLSGLFYRNIKLLESNIKPIYIFDGKKKDKKLRHSNINKPKYYVSINDNIISSSKVLLKFMGIQSIQAIGEGEAQGVYMANKGDVWATASQDYDVLIYGGDRLIRNLAIGSSRKKGDIIINLNIEFIKLSKFLDLYGITKDRLVELSVLIGNDYFCGVKGLGAMTAMKLIQKCETFYDIKFNNNSLYNGNIILKDKTIMAKEVLYSTYKYYKNLFLNPEVNMDYRIKRIKPDYEGLYNYLTVNNFSISRVENGIKRLRNVNSKYRQSMMSDYM